MNEDRSFARALSVSAIRQFDRCRLAFRFRYMDRLVEEPTEPMLVGLVVHRALEAYVGGLWSRRETGRNPAALEAAIDGLRGDFPVAYLEAGARILRDWLEGRPEMFDGVAEARFEERFAFGPAWEKTDWRAPRVRFRGVIDRAETLVDGSLRVTDYKATWRMLAASEVEEDFQLRVYGWAARLLWPDVKRIVVRFEYPTLGRFREADLGDGDLDDVRRTIEAKEAAVVAERDWLPHVGSACATCAFRSRCPAFAEAVKSRTLPVLTPENAAEVARAWRARRAWNDEVEAALKVYAEERPIVDPATGAVVAQFTTSEETRIEDAEGAVDALLAAGVPSSFVWRFLRISKDSIETAGRSVGLSKARVAAIVDRVGKKVPKSTFRFRGERT